MRGRERDARARGEGAAPAGGEALDGRAAQGVGAARVGRGGGGGDGRRLGRADRRRAGEGGRGAALSRCRGGGGVVILLRVVEEGGDGGLRAGGRGRVSWGVRRRGMQCDAPQHCLQPSRGRTRPG